MDGQPDGLRPWPAGALLTAVATLLFFGQLSAPLLEPQEPRYAEIPRQMLAEGRCLTPVLHGQPYLDKPPLLYWFVMASYQVCGVHDWSARLIPAFVGVLTVLATWWWGRHSLSERAGFWGALILCLSARFVYLERMLTMDGLLCLCVTVALGTGQRALLGLDRRSRYWLVASAAACGLGLLAKGPLALVLVVPPILAYRWLQPSGLRLTWRDAALSLGVLFAVAGPWYLALSILEPDFAWTFFWTHNVMRFVAPFDHQEPFWFHLPGLLLGMLPWTLLLPGLLFGFIKHPERRTPALNFCLLAFLWSVLFFSASGCKRAVYILPALPPLALALGAYLDTLFQTERRDVLARAATVVTLTLGVGVALTATYKQLLSPPLGLTLAGIAFLGLTTALVWRRVASWPLTAAATGLCLLAGVFLLLPAYNEQFALRQELQQAANASSTARLTVVCYPQRYDSVSYYLPDAEVRVYTAQQKEELFRGLRTGTLLLVKSGRPLEDLLSEKPKEMEFVSPGKAGAVTVGWVRVNDKAGNAVAQRE